MTARSPAFRLTPEQKDRIIDAPCLEVLPRRKRRLEKAIDNAARSGFLVDLLHRTRLVPSRDARKARAATSAIDRALELLEERPGLADGSLMAWAGNIADEDPEQTPAPGEPVGFERATNVGARRPALASVS